MRQVLCIGHSSYDITLPVEAFPIENRKYNIKEVFECGGGPAGNAAYLIAKWGMRCTYAGCVGNDSYGLKIKKELKDVGVDLKYLVVDENYSTPFSFILANSKNGSRTLFNHDDKNKKSNRIEFDNHKVHTILVDGHELQASLEALNQYPDAISILDGGSFNERTEILSKMVDYLVCSEDFAKQYTGLHELESKNSRMHAFDQLRRLNDKNIVITLGEKGCLLEQDGEILHQKTYKVNAVDSTGAGDIFHGAFAYGMTQRYDIMKTIKMASIAAALSVEKIGGRVAIPSLEEVMDLYEKNVI